MLSADSKKNYVAHRKKKLHAEKSASYKKFVRYENKVRRRCRCREFNGLFLPQNKPKAPRTFFLQKKNLSRSIYRRTRSLYLYARGAIVYPLRRVGGYLLFISSTYNVIGDLFT